MKTTLSNTKLLLMLHVLAALLLPIGCHGSITHDKKSANTGIERYVLPFKHIVEAAGYRQNIDPLLLHAIIFNESRYRPNAISPRGAQGLMQLMPGTAKELGVDNSFDPVENISGGARYYRHLLNQFANNHYKALLAYHSGASTVRKGVFYKESLSYADKVVSTWKALHRILGYTSYKPQHIESGGQPNDQLQ